MAEAARQAGGWVRGVRDAAMPLVDLVLPPRCLLCGALVQSAGPGLCAACWQALPLVGEPWCALCHRPFGAEEDHAGLTCAACIAAPPRHDGILAALAYGDAAATIAVGLKHSGRLGHARLMAALMGRHVGALEGDWLLVPVPLHRWRLWRRGFNQAALLARALARAHGQALCIDALVRRRATPMLRGLSRTARARALQGAIAVHPHRAARLRGANVLLVDDVHTSGATAAACVAALKRAGAARVKIAVFARVLREGETGAGR